MSVITPNVFIQVPEDTTQATTTPEEELVTIYFLTGNPGLIGYYHSFLSLLSSRLGASVPNTRFQVYGHSLAGFELDDSSGSKDEKGTKGEPQIETDDDYYYDVEAQILFAQKRLDGFLKTHTHGGRGSGSGSGQGRRQKVILMGHSVGAYLAMEILRRHREREKEGAPGTGTGTGTATAEFDIIGGVMLFPTVVDIAKSQSGRKLTMLLYLIPHLALVASFLARFLTALVSESILRALVAAFMRLNSISQPESSVLDTTCGFLKSKRGVRQAVHLGASEMKTITSDKWSDDIWGIPRVQEPLAKLFFYFGRNDHWVADRTRDDILAARGWRPRGPTMVVCQDGLPHAFCLRYNGTMARKTADMVQAIIQGQK